jgi:hypothetical protein
MASVVCCNDDYWRIDMDEKKSDRVAKVPQVTLLFLDH